MANLATLLDLSPEALDVLGLNGEDTPSLAMLETIQVVVLAGIHDYPGWVEAEIRATWWAQAAEQGWTPEDAGEGVGQIGYIEEVAGGAVIHLVEYESVVSAMESEEQIERDERNALRDTSIDDSWSAPRSNSPSGEAATGAQYAHVPVIERWDGQAEDSSRFDENDMSEEAPTFEAQLMFPPNVHLREEAELERGRGLTAWDD